MNIDSGAYRTVFLLNNYVVKIPKGYREFLGKDYNSYKKYSWIYFIEGLKSNKKEINNWRNYKNLRNIMCPITFHDIFGLVLVMRRAESLTCDKFNEANDLISKYRNHPIFEDIKKDNLGVLNNKVVLIDYGGVL